MMPAAAGPWLLAAPPGDPSAGSGKGAEWGSAAPIGLLVLLLLGAALILLVKSMNRNLRKVPATFDPAGQDGPAESAALGKGAGDSALVDDDGGEDGGEDDDDGEDDDSVVDGAGDDAGDSPGPVTEMPNVPRSARHR